MNQRMRAILIRRHVSQLGLKAKPHDISTALTSLREDEIIWPAAS